MVLKWYWLWYLFNKYLAKTDQHSVDNFPLENLAHWWIDISKICEKIFSHFWLLQVAGESVASGFIYNITENGSEGKWKFV